MPKKRINWFPRSETSISSVCHQEESIIKVVPSTNPHPTINLFNILREVARGSLGGLRRNADILDHDGLTAGAGDANIDRLGTISSRVLEVVVLLALGFRPCLAAISGDLERGDSDVGVLDLHAEPVRAGAGLVLEHNGRGDAARHKVPGDGDDALAWVGKCAEAGRVQVQVVVAAAGALVDDHGGDLVT